MWPGHWHDNTGFFVEQIAPGLYIFIGIGLFFAWRWWRRSSRALRATHFELERDLHRYRRANALTVMILLVEFALAVLGVQRVVSPAVRSTVDTTQTIERVVADGELYYMDAVELGLLLEQWGG